MGPIEHLCVEGEAEGDQHHTEISLRVDVKALL